MASQTYARRNYIHDAADGSARELQHNDGRHPVDPRKEELGAH